MHIAVSMDQQDAEIPCPRDLPRMSSWLQLLKKNCEESKPRTEMTPESAKQIPATPWAEGRGKDVHFQERWTCETADWHGENHPCRQEPADGYPSPVAMDLLNS